MGLQTWNTIRSLDFLLGLPEVDAKRIGVTGASGGGTQTFILGAIDSRPAAAFPAVMVSTQMQGGCTCENCSLLRIGTGNVEFAALFAPRPLGMTGARDWTIDIERKGLPELKALYKLYGAEDRVLARCFPQFGHNYNQVSREVMYNFFNKHLALKQPSPVTEKPFVLVPAKDLTVYTRDHPLPRDVANAQRVRDYLTGVADKQIDALRPTDDKKLAEFRSVIGTALRVLVHDRLPAPKRVEFKAVPAPRRRPGPRWSYHVLGRRGQNEQIPALLARGRRFGGRVVVWIHPRGKASLVEGNKPVPAVRRLLNAGCAVLAPDIFGTGELTRRKPPAIRADYAGYTFGYNRTLLAQRVHDILTAVRAAQQVQGAKTIHLVGWEKAGPWVLIARGLCGDAVARTAADVNGFRFDKVRRMDDEMMLPGALKYGGLSAFTALAAPAELFVHHHGSTGLGRYLKPAYQSAGAAGKLTRSSNKVSDDKVVEWLLR
jgi:dienelactone hydrolase